MTIAPERLHQPPQPEADVELVERGQNPLPPERGSDLRRGDFRFKSVRLTPTQWENSIAIKNHSVPPHCWHRVSGGQTGHPTDLSLSDDPKLPRVLLMGDSSVPWRITGGGESCSGAWRMCIACPRTALHENRSTARMASSPDCRTRRRWTSFTQPWPARSLVSFTAMTATRSAEGEYASPTNSEQQNVPPGYMKKNLRQIIARLKQTGGHAHAFADTTPRARKRCREVCEGTPSSPTTKSSRRRNA